LNKKPLKEAFRVNDMVVYPGHGVGKVTALLTKSIGGSEHKFFEIHIAEACERAAEVGMKILVPVFQAESVGLRKVVDKKAVEKVFLILKDRKAKIDTQTWNRRFREYSQKIKTGSVFEIAEVLRDLSVLSFDKELSFGEKRMLDTAETLLVSELAIAKARSQDKIQGEIRALFT
jgi:CarD family transcriptional regulator